MPIPESYARVACFSSIDYFDRIGEEWLRDDKVSQLTLTQMVNAFLDDTGAVPITMSAPQVTVLSRTDDRQAHRTTASLIYRPKEIVVNGESTGVPAGLKEATDAFAEKIREYINPPNNTR